MDLFISILYGIATLCTLLFAYFRYLDAITTNKKDQVKYQYHLYWRKLDNLKIIYLPEKVIRWFISLENYITVLNNSKLIKVLSSWFRTPLGIIITLGYGGYIILSGRLEHSMLMRSPIIDILWLLHMFFLFYIISRSHNVDKSRRHYKFVILNRILGYILITSLFSYSISAIALYQGDVLNYNYKDYLGRIFTINFVLDFLTLVFTVLILKLALLTKNIFFQLILIGVDIFLTFSLTCIDLYSISIITKEQISFQEIINIILGKSSDGKNWNINQWFYLVHTTLIPTIFYLTILVFSLFAKTVILPISKIIGNASILDRPHWITAVSFSMFGVSAGALASFLYWLN